MTTTTGNPLIESNPKCGIKIDAAIIAEPFRNEIRQRVQVLKEHGIGM
jgi:hypothetical protein